METKNGIIRSTFFDIKDHGIMTIRINIEGNGWGAGGYFLLKTTRTLLQKSEKCSTLWEKEKWEELPGTRVRIRGTRSQIIAGGNIIKDEWFYFEKK